MSKLAILGGPKVNTLKDYEVNPWPIIEDEDIDAVVKAIKNDNLFGVHNERIAEFEKAYAEYVGCEYALVVNSGTAALHLAIAGSDLTPGDEVIVPNFTFVASATCVLHHNGIPVFVDIEPRTYNVMPDLIEDKITDKTRAIMAVHFQGLCADMASINQIAERHNIKVIEDASQAFGAEYKGKKAGNLADMAGTSIMVGKNLPVCGEGGVFTTNDAELRDKADMVRMFGEKLKKDERRAYNAYVMGWNYRANVIQCVFGLSQLKRADEYSRKRIENGLWLSRRLKEEVGFVEPPYIPEDCTHVYHIYRVKVNGDSLGMGVSERGKFRLAVMNALAAEGIPAMEYTNTPVSSQLLFQIREGYGKGCPWTCQYANDSGRDTSYRFEDYPNTLEALDTTFILQGVTLPSHTEQYRCIVVDAFKKVERNKDELMRYMDSMGEYVPPYKQMARLY